MTRFDLRRKAWFQRELSALFGPRWPLKCVSPRTRLFCTGDGAFPQAAHPFHVAPGTGSRSSAYNTVLPTVRARVVAGTKTCCSGYVYILMQEYKRQEFPRGQEQAAAGCEFPPIPFHCASSSGFTGALPCFSGFLQGKPSLDHSCAALLRSHWLKWSKSKVPVA
jgi:hypothetical protein